MMGNSQTNRQIKSTLAYSHDFVFESKSWQLETGVREDLKRFFFHDRTESARESCWKLK